MVLNNTLYIHDNQVMEIALSPEHLFIRNTICLFLISYYLSITSANIDNTGSYKKLFPFNTLKTLPKEKYQIINKIINNYKVFHSQKNCEFIDQVRKTIQSL